MSVGYKKAIFYPGTEEEFSRKDNLGREARLLGEVIVAVHCMAERFPGVPGRGWFSHWRQCRQ